MKKLLVILIALSVFAAACGSDDDDATEATTTTEAEATTTTEAADEGGDDEAAIAEAYLTLFSKESPREEAVAALEEVDGKDAIVAQAETNTAEYTAVKAEVSAVEVDGDQAAVTFTLTLEQESGDPLVLEDQKGIAVKDASGEWKVGAHTLCTLLTLGETPAECQPILDGTAGAQPAA